MTDTSALIEGHHLVTAYPAAWCQCHWPLRWEHREQDHSAHVIAAIQAQALREAADVLDRPRVIWYGDGGVTVLEAGADATLDDYRAERPTVVEWLRARADRLTDTTEGATT